MTVFLGTQALVSGQTASQDIGQGGYRGFIVGNESGLTLIVAYDGTGYSKSLYPGTVDFFPVPRSGISSSKLLFKTNAFLNNIADWPSSFVQIDAIGVGEQINEAAYPMALPRTFKGDVTATVSNSNQLFNQGNPDGTNIINVTDSLGATWLFDNNGIGTLHVNIGGSLAQVLKLDSSDPLVTLGATGAHIVAVLGRLQIEAKKINDSTDINLVDWSAGGVFLKGNPSNINKFQYQSDGVHNDWARTAEISGTNVTVNGAKVVTHNLLAANVAALPDIVVVMPTQASAAWYIDTITNTQFSIHTTAVWNFTWLAIKL